ncbi:MAG TPA: MBL fold metallo-hydrolase [Polyangia bacterium]|nr:MBL fold metallo-hydrolase [Polyangia bacterium]
MRRVLLLATALLAATLSIAPAGGRRAWAAAGNPVGKLTWFGQSCFLLETAAGTRILMDPFQKTLGYPIPQGLRADLITLSHEHPDHDNARMVVNSPKVIHGVTADKKGWVRVDDKFRDVALRTVGVYHDDKRGALRGLDTVFIFEVGGLRIAHLGDLGHLLDDDELEAIGSVDVLLVPVGGSTTLDAYHATRVVDQLHPRLMVIPMHYRTDVAGTKDLDPVDPFLERKANVRHPASPTVALTPVKARPATEIVVLPYR